MEDLLEEMVQDYLNEYKGRTGGENLSSMTAGIPAQSRSLLLAKSSNDRKTSLFALFHASSTISDISPLSPGFFSQIKKGSGISEPFFPLTPRTRGNTGRFPF